MSWTVIYTDLKSGTILGELPVTAFTYTDVLNADGGFTITTPLVTATPTGRLVNDVSAVQLTEADLAPAKTAVYFQRDNALFWGGVVWGVDADVAANTLTISGAGFLSYFRHRTIKTDYEPVGVDQLTIARTIIDTAQAVGGGDVNVKTSETATSGRTRDRTYYAYERKVVSDVLQQLSNVQDGFDFRFDPGYVSGEIETEFRTTYPSTGRRTEHVFELGTNIQLLGFKSDGTRITNHVDAVGGGDGEALPIQTAQDATGLASRPLLESVLSLSDVTVPATLLEHAKRGITRGSAPIKTLEVEVFADQVPVLGSYIIGDQVTVKGSYGYIDLAASWFRITSINISVAVSGAEVTRLTLVPLGVFDD